MKHNVKAYLEASGNYNRLKQTGEIDIITKLMAGYAQIYYNNQVKNIEVIPCCKSDSELLVCTYCGIQTNQEHCPHPKKCANKEKIKAN